MTELNEAARILRDGPADARLSLARDASAPRRGGGAAQPSTSSRMAR